MKNGSKRTISRVLAFVMLVTSMFTNIIIANADSVELLAGDDVASGSAVTYSFDATTLPVGADKDALTQDEVDSYFTVVGSITKRNSSDGSQVNSVELAKNDGGQFSFTTTADSSALSFDFSSTGSSNTSAYAVLDSGGATVAEGEVTGSANGRTTVTVNDLGPDTYTITSPDKGYNRGGRIYTITVVENGSLDEPPVVEPEEPTETTTAEVTETTTQAPSGETGVPEAGQTYTANFAALNVGDKLNGWSTEDGIINVVSATDGAYVHDAQHGAALVDGDQINVAVAGNATLTLTLCQYGAGTTFTVTDSNGKVIDTVPAIATKDGDTAVINYLGDPTVLTITLAATGEAYLHSVTAANAAAPIGEAKDFEIWLDDIAVDSVVATGAYTGDVTLNDGSTVVALGDSILELQGEAQEQFTQSYGAAIGVIRDGKTVNGYKAGKRNANANDINPIPSQGDGCAIVFTPAATGMLNTYFVSTSFLRVWDFDTASGERLGYTDSEVAAESYGVKVEAGHTYVLSTTGKTNNMAFCGFEYVVDAPTTVAVSLNNINANPDSIPNLEIYLTDAILGGEPVATVKADTASVDLSNKHAYTLSTNDGGVKATVNGSDTFTATGDAIVIDLEDIPDVTLTGELTGAYEGVTGVTFTNMINGTTYNATVEGNTYSVSLKPGDYDTSVTATNGAFTQDRVKVVAGEENVNEVYVEIVDPSKPATYSPADLFKLEHSEGVGAREADITAKAGDTITVPVDGAAVVTVTSYYQAAFTVNGSEVFGSDSNSTSIYDSFTVNTAEGDTAAVITFTDSYNGTAIGTSYLTSISVVPVVEFKSEISVPGDYATLTEAVAAIKGMDRPEGEAGRVTINMTADIEEQVVFDAPYITLNGNGHTLSWYYGVGSFYYSINPSTGLYTESLYRDRYSSTEANGQLWGGVAIIRGDNFITHDTTFLNTYNYEVTEKEASDVAYSVASMPVRELGADVTVYASKERSNAFYIDADNIEAYNCKILSSQDTLGRNSSANNNYHAYFKDCVIGGNTDYICGEFTAIFDNCELQWKTFANDDTNNGKVGMITAPKTSPYIFRNCTVTTSGLEGTGAVSGLYGRTWGADSQAYFLNTETNGLVSADGWGEMSAGEGASSKFYEYNNTSNGEAFVSNGAFSKVLEDETTIANMTSDAVIDVYLAGWRPVSYAYEVNPGKLWGDVDGDGDVDVIDVTLTLDYTLQPESVETFDTSAADVSGDGQINSEDVALILQKVLDSIFKFPVEEGGVVPPEDTTESTTEGTTEDTTEATTETPTETTTEEPAPAEDDVYLPSAEAAADQQVFAGSGITIKAAQDLQFKEGVTDVVNGTTYNSYAQTSSKNTSLTIGDAASSYRLAYEITASEDVTLKVDHKVGSGKGNYILKNVQITGTAADGTTPAGTAEVVLENFNDGTSSVYDSFVFELKAGETVWVAGQGTNICVYGIYVLPAGSEVTTEAPTETTTEAPTEPTTSGGGDEPTADFKVYVIGDSTACHYADTADAGLYIKRTGYGDKIGDYINAEVVNLALSGRSSKSYTTDPEYQTLMNSVEAGDYVLIGFGHNDEKAGEEARYTAPGGTKEEEGTFKNSLYVNYIVPLQEKGAIPVIVTPIVRRTTGSWSDSQLHIANGGDYRLSGIELADELGLVSIDATTLTKELYDTLTPEGSKLLHSWGTSKDTSVDNTHLNSYGASYVAYLIANALKDTDCELASYVKSGITAPATPAIEELVNPGYVEPSGADPEDLTSQLWTTTSPWYGSAFGNLGGEGKLYAVDPETGLKLDPPQLAQEVEGIDNFKIEELEGGSVNIRAGVPSEGKSYGKIEGNGKTDGLIMYYQPITAGGNFEITGTITVNDFINNSQVAFGAIISDNMKVDTNISENYKYVTAGAFRISDIGKTNATTGEIMNGVTSYARVDGQLELGARDLTSLEPGDVLEVSIKKIGNKFICTCNGSVTEYTVDMEGTAYAGFFAARSADITVSNITYNNEVVE